MGFSILEGWNPFFGLSRAIDGTVAVLSDPGDLFSIRKPPMLSTCVDLHQIQEILLAYHVLPILSKEFAQS